MRVILVLFFAAIAYCEVLDIKHCDGVATDKCTIKEIRVDPCQNKNSCRLTKGTNVNIAFDFVPHFSAAKLITLVTWNNLPWTDVNTDACQDTPCPVTDGQAQTYSSSVHIGKKLPNGKYTFKWSMYDESNAANACCFVAGVQLRKP